jgi:flagellar biosynthesis protein FlhG
MAEQETAKEMTIIPVASGKGGVGKSVITANLSVSLAEKGCRVVAVDLDLGGSNLHTCLGLDNNNPGIGDYLRAHYGDLDELLVDTYHPNLKFLAGDAGLNLPDQDQRQPHGSLFPQDSPKDWR